MKVCIIGGGVSGVYAAKRLSEYGIESVIVEKEGRLLGNYNYSSEPYAKKHITDLVNSRYTKVLLNTTLDKIKKDDYDMFVVATGGIPRLPDGVEREHYMTGLDVVKKLFEGKLEYLGDRVVIVGFGDVTLDITKYLYGKCKEILIVTKTTLQESRISRHLLKKQLATSGWVFSRILSKFKTMKRQEREGHDPQVKSGYIKPRINKIIDKIKEETVESIKFLEKNTVKIIENSKVDSIISQKDKKIVNINIDGETHPVDAEKVIYSIGFVPNSLSIQTKKPIVYVGWSDVARGNINRTIFETIKKIDDSVKNYLTEQSLSPRVFKSAI